MSKGVNYWRVFGVFVLLLTADFVCDEDLGESTILGK